MNLSFHGLLLFGGGVRFNKACLKPTLNKIKQLFEFDFVVLDMDKQETTLINELVTLLKGGSAHAGLKKALAGLPPELRGAKAGNLPYTIWQLVEHIRIAQWDMLEFSKDGNHQSPEWPDEYWPKQAAPADNDAWNNAVKQIDTDLNAFIELVKNADIYAPIPHGTGQTILREALQIADHNAYHTAEIIVIRRLLGAWQ
jgi:uncharacterized damage-inducible protein DinB